jgi:hypothetical protein
VFDGLSAGAYFGQFSALGYVDPNGANVVRPPNGWNVTTGATSISTYQYDLAGQINIAFDTRYTAANPVWSINSGNAATGPAAVTLLHGNVPGPPLQGMRVDDVPINVSTYVFDDLFPFTTQYAAFAGKCATAAPSWTTPGSATVPPGGTATPNPLVLRMPAIGVRVQRNGGALTRDADVFVRPATGSCISKRNLGPVAQASGLTAPTSAANAQLYALPPGDYIVCADDRSGTGGTAQKREVSFSNNNEDGQLITVDIGNSSPSVAGHCTP